MSVLPDAAPLEDPPGRVDAVLDAAGDARLAAGLLRNLAEGLGAARARGWAGQDALAVGERADVASRLASDAGEALLRASARLAAHAELWRSVLARTAVLRAEQERERHVARQRVATPLDPLDPFAPPVDDALASLAAAESGRAAEHRRLLALLDDDASETGRALRAACAAVGATGPDRTRAALLHVAAVLPAWGGPELARRARHVVASLMGRPDERSAGPEDVDALLREELPFADHPRYAAAFLHAMDGERAPALLAGTWVGTWTGTRFPEMLGRILSGLDRDAAVPGWLPTLLDDSAEGGMLPGVTGGLAAALVDARRRGRAGPPPALAAAWAGSLIAVERTTGAPVDLGVPPRGADPATIDPLALVLDTLLRQQAVVETAELLRSPEAWAGVLGRGWDDGGALVDELVHMVAEAPADAARPALRSALVAVGTGLEDSDPVDWPIDQAVLARAAPSLTTAISRHVEVVRAALAVAARGARPRQVVAALRGLSVVLGLHEEAEEAIADALLRIGGRSSPGGSGIADAAASAVVVTTALAAVAAHGSDLVAAMGEFREKRRAEDRAALWDVTAGIPFTLLGFVPRAGVVAGVAEAVVTRVLRTNGYHVNDVQLAAGSRFRLGVSGYGGETGGRDRQALVRASLHAFLTTREVLGVARLPAETDPGVLRDLAAAAAGDAVGAAVSGRFEKRPLLGTVVGELSGDGTADQVRD